MNAEDMQTLLATGALVAAPHYVEEGKGVPFAFVPNGTEVVSLEDYLPAPQRLCQLISLQDAQSFIAYVLRFKDEDTLVLFDHVKHDFFAIFDYHRSGKAEAGPVPRRCEHRALFRPQETPAWREWTASNGRRMAQADFGRFLEDHADDLAPEHVSLLSTAMALEYKREETLSSVQPSEANNGMTVLRYEETIQGRAMETKVHVPTGFRVDVQPYFGTELATLKCRLHYGRSGQTIHFWYQITNLQQVIEETLRDIRHSIATAINLDVFDGAL